MAQDRSFLSRQKGVGELHESRASHGSHLLHSDKELPAGLCSKTDPQHSPLGKFSLPNPTPKRDAKSRCRLLLKLHIQFHFHITKDTNMRDVNMTLHHVWALSAGTSSMDCVSPNKQSSEARKAAQKQPTQKEHLPEIRVIRGEKNKTKATLYCYAAFHQKISENRSQKTPVKC